MSADDDVALHAAINAGICCYSTCRCTAGRLATAALDQYLMPVRRSAANLLQRRAAGD